MEERCGRNHFGGMVFAVVVGGMILHHLANHEHSCGHGPRHERFAKMWQKRHARFHDWANCHCQEDTPEEKSEEAAA